MLYPSYVCHYCWSCTLLESTCEGSKLLLLVTTSSTRHHTHEGWPHSQKVHHGVKYCLRVTRQARVASSPIRHHNTQYLQIHVQIKPINPRGNHTLSQRAAQPIISVLGLKLAVEKQWRAIWPPRILIPNSPHRNTNTVLHVRARTHRRLVVRHTRALDIQFCNRALIHDFAQRLQRAREIGNGPVVRQVRLRANTVDGDAGCNPLLYLGHHGFGLGVRGGVEVVVVDVELCGWVSGAGGFEGCADEAFA